MRRTTLIIVFAFVSHAHTNDLDADHVVGVQGEVADVGINVQAFFPSDLLSTTLEKPGHQVTSPVMHTRRLSLNPMPLDRPRMAQAQLGPSPFRLLSPFDVNRHHSILLGRSVAASAEVSIRNLPDGSRMFTFSARPEGEVFTKAEAEADLKTFIAQARPNRDEIEAAMKAAEVLLNAPLKRSKSEVETARKAAEEMDRKLVTDSAKRHSAEAGANTNTEVKAKLKAFIAKPKPTQDEIEAAMKAAEILLKAPPKRTKAEVAAAKKAAEEMMGKIVKESDYPQGTPAEAKVGDSINAFGKPRSRPSKDEIEAARKAAEMLLKTPAKPNKAEIEAAKRAAELALQALADSSETEMEATEAADMVQASPIKAEKSARPTNDEIEAAKKIAEMLLKAPAKPTKADIEAAKKAAQAALELVQAIDLEVPRSAYPPLFMTIGLTLFTGIAVAIRRFCRNASEAEDPLLAV